MSHKKKGRNMSNSVMIVVMSGHPGETETHEAFMILRAILKHGPECQPNYLLFKKNKECQ